MEKVFESAINWKYHNIATELFCYGPKKTVKELLPKDKKSLTYLAYEVTLQLQALEGKVTGDKISEREVEILLDVIQEIAKKDLQSASLLTTRTFFIKDIVTTYQSLRQQKKVSEETTKLLHRLFV